MHTVMVDKFKGQAIKLSRQPQDKFKENICHGKKNYYISLLHYLWRGVLYLLLLLYVNKADVFCMYVLYLSYDSSIRLIHTFPE